MKFIAVLISFLICFSSTGSGVFSPESVYTPLKIQSDIDIDNQENLDFENSDSWWVNWFRDRNSNKIDDLIEDSVKSAQDIFPVFIDYDERPDAQNLKSLEELDVEISYVARYIDTVCALSVPYSTIQQIVKMPHVVMVELQPEVESHLDVSSPSVRSGPSSDYSPYSAVDLKYSGRDVVIAILDTGVDDSLHQSLRGKFVGGADIAGVVRLNNTNQSCMHSIFSL